MEDKVVCIDKKDNKKMDKSGGFIISDKSIKNIGNFFNGLIIPSINHG